MNWIWFTIEQVQQIQISEKYASIFASVEYSIEIIRQIAIVKKENLYKRDDCLQRKKTLY